MARARKSVKSGGVSKKQKVARKSGKAEPYSNKEDRDFVSGNNDIEKERSAEALFPVVGCGASAGGLEAFLQLLRHLPVDSGMSFVLVQHLDPIRESALPKLLSKATSMDVREAENNTRIEPNKVYVIPPNTSIHISGKYLKLLPRERADGPPRPIDSFLYSLAEDRREKAIAVILSGTASDGTLGCEAIKAEGGITFAQDESAAYESMPRSAIAAGCIDYVLSPEGIAKELSRIARHPYVLSEHSRDDGENIAAPSSSLIEPAIWKQPSLKEAPLKKILLLIKKGLGVDFSTYKQNTIKRRIARRMLLCKVKTLDAYLRHLRNDPRELQSLYEDMLINVTGFFRNPEAFDVLKKEVFPKLLKNRSLDDPIRVWVLGCSTGQEAYSIAMNFLEFASKIKNNVGIQVFATDLNDGLLDKARAGLYAKPLVNDLSPERLRRFFIEEDGSYRISKAIRDMCVFARQNVMSDPPFSRIDLISCRNLLIYLEPSEHKRIIPTLHYALKPNGFLFLGASESIGTNADLFTVVDKKNRIFMKKATARRSIALSPTAGYHLIKRPDPVRLMAMPRDVPELDAQREADRVTLNRYAPAGVLVNSELEILQFRGATSIFLAPAPGRASFNLLKMAREGLMMPLRSALNKAKKESQRVRKEGVTLKYDEKTARVNIEVIPLKNLKDRCYLVLFEAPERRTASRQNSNGGAKPAGGSPKKPAKNGDDRQQAQELAQLKREIDETREYLQSVLEEHEAATEELQASNEEVQSTNEELQSINEELETSKEELESANEELITVNEELQGRNQELNRLNSDLSNLHSNINMSIVLLSRDLTIRRFTSTAEKELNLLATDIGQPIGRIKTDLEPVDLETLSAEVISTVSPRQAEVKDRAGRWYSLRIRPYLTLDNKVDGAVLMLVDIDALKRGEELSSHLAAIVESSDDAIFSKSLEGMILTWNAGAERIFGYSAKEIIGKPVHILSPADRADEEPDILAKLRRGERIIHFETVRVTKSGVPVDVSLSISPMKAASGLLLAASTIARDITHRKRIEDELKDSLMSEQAARREAEAANRVKDDFLAMMSHELRTPLNAISGWARLLRSGMLDKNDIEKAIEVIDRNAMAQATIINELLDISRLMSGKLRLESKQVNLSDIIVSAVETMRPNAEAKLIEITTKLGSDYCEVTGDKVRMEQAVLNLLSNALKFSHKGGRVEVSLRRTENEAVISVRDNGQGITPDFLPHVFERFRQADGSEKRTHGGLGLGLTIARRLVEMHGGNISAESEGDGKGATFIVSLPTTSPKAAESRTRLAHNKAGPQDALGEALPDVLQGSKVLVVDDHSDSRELMNVALSQYGAEVHEAATAKEALKIVQRWKPDLIISDIGMPGEDGYDLIQKIRALRPEEGGRVPALAFTGYASLADESKALASGYQGHMSKPVDISELPLVVARLITQGDNR